MKPKSLMQLIETLHKLPGISKKQAERIAYYLIKDREQNISQALVWSLEEVEAKIKTCEICFHYTENQICDICLDKNRQKTLVIVESPLDVFKFEDTNTIRAYYHVLGGLVNISKRIDFEDLNIANLKVRAEDYKEIILALSPNLEGIVTANFIKSLLGNKKVTQLAQGIPLGAAMEYVDEITLKAALDNRKEVK